MENHDTNLKDEAVIIDPLQAEYLMNAWEQEVMRGVNVSAAFTVPRNEDSVLKSITEKQGCVGCAMSINDLPVLAGYHNADRLRIRFGYDQLSMGIKFKMILSVIDSKGNRVSPFIVLNKSRLVSLPQLNNPKLKLIKSREMICVGTSMGLLPAQVANYIFRNWAYNGLGRQQILSKAFTVSGGHVLKGTNINIRELRNALILPKGREVTYINFMFTALSLTSSNPVNSYMRRESFDIMVMSNGPKWQSEEFENSKQCFSNSEMDGPITDVHELQEMIFGKGQVLSDPFDITAPCPFTCG